MLAMCSVYVYRIPIEEKMLLETYTDYAEYRKYI